MNCSPTTMKDEYNSEYHMCKNKWTLYSHLPHDTDWSIKSYQNIVNIESNQVVTTSGISPHIWVDELSITGDA